MDRDAVIIVLARAPVPGRCKTRLVPALGRLGAARLHRRLALRTVRTATATGSRVELWCAPDAGHALFRACRRDFGVTLRRQPRGDLGHRMTTALADTLSAGASAAVLVGTDCPGLDPAALKQALRALEDHDAVLQPSTDGGYVLIGARSIRRGALAGIAWSSGRELAQTRARFRRLGARVAGLPPLPDVDTPADYRRARRAGILRDRSPR